MTARARLGALGALGILAGGCSPDVEAAIARQTDPITIESLTEIRHPSQAVWSPDGRRVAFVWDQSGVQNVHVLEVDSPESRALTRFDSPHVDGDVWIQNGPIQGLFWSRDGSRLLFSHGGSLWSVDAGGAGEAAPIRGGPEAAQGYALSPDGRRVAFSREGDLWTLDLQDGGEVRLTRTPEAESGPVWSPDGRWIAYTVAEVARRQETPAYLGEKMHFSWSERVPADVGVVASRGGESRRLGQGPGNETSPQWIDASRLVFQRITPDQKAREILVADARTGAAKTIRREVDDRWWSLTYVDPGPKPSPDGRWISFISDRDGWDHLYVMPAEGGEAIQLTRGEFEVRRPAWSPDGSRIAFDVNSRESPGARTLSLVTLSAEPASARIQPLTSGRGVDGGAVWSPSGDRLLFQRSSPQHPADLFVVPASGGERKRLTQSLPESLRDVDFVAPEFVRYPSADGSQVPAYLFVPPGLDRSREHPAIVWVHGDGVTQNFDGWHDRRDYAVYSSIHQYLLQQGYVVLAVDYRGSIGYGKEWRQGHFRDLGGKDYQDVAAGRRYLETLGFVDPERVGVWGLSYGGFMTLQALTVTPDLFACGIDVAGVVDWRDWYRDPGGPWIHGRMGSPEENPELYQRTAPIHRVERIVRPLLVLHGTADVNVPFLESVRLVDRLTKEGRAVEFMLYPGEFHYLHRAHVLQDAWSRVDRFFGRCLQEDPPRGASD